MRVAFPSRNSDQAERDSVDREDGGEKPTDDAIIDKRFSQPEPLVHLSMNEPQPSHRRQHKHQNAQGSKDPSRKIVNPVHHYAHVLSKRFEVVREATILVSAREQYSQ